MSKKVPFNFISRFCLKYSALQYLLQYILHINVYTIVDQMPPTSRLPRSWNELTNAIDEYYRASDFPRSRNSRNCRLETESVKFPIFFLCQSHMAFSCVLSFLLSTHSIDCAVPLLLSIHVLIVPFFFRSLIVLFFFSSPH